MSKTELMTALWPDTHVSEATLTGVVADAREALGDDGRAPRLIRTVHRFGYAFTGQVEREVSADSAEPVLGWLIAERGGCRCVRARRCWAAKATAWCRSPRPACRGSTRR